MSNETKKQELTFTYSWTKEDVERMLSDRKDRPITISDEQWEAMCYVGNGFVCTHGQTEVFDENFLDSLMDEWLENLKED